MRHPKIAAALLLAGTLGAALALSCGSLDSPDATARYFQAKAIALRGSLATPAEWFAPGEPPPGILPTGTGLYASKYGVGLPLLWVPAIWAAALAHAATGLDTDRIAGFLIPFVNALVTLATALSIDLAGRRTGADRPGRGLALLTFLALNMTIPYATSSFSEPLVGLLLFWAVCTPLLRGPDRAAAVASGLITAFAILVKTEMALVVPAVALAFRPWGRRALYAAAAGAGPAVVLLMNWGLRGSPLRFSYGSEGSEFLAPWRGLHGFLIGGDRNLFIFGPGIVLGLVAWARLPRDSPLRPGRASVLLTAAIFLGFYSSWWAWNGGFCFGPRFLLPLAPIAALPAGPFLLRLLGPAGGARGAAARGLLALVVAASVAIQAGGSAVKVNQGIGVSVVTDDPQWLTHLKLLGLKLRRGIRAAEVYHKSDFVRLAPGEADAVIDHRGNLTFQYLNYWWSIVLANRLRGRAIDL